MRPQDVAVALKLVCYGEQEWTYSELAHDIGVSPSEAHAAVARLKRAGLLGPHDSSPRRARLLEFLVHGLPYVFPVDRGRVTRGMPTAHAAPPLAQDFEPDGLPPVWPDPEGRARGETVKPLYRSAPFAAKKDPRLYRFLALVDAIRGGRARERKRAAEYLKQELASV